MSGDYGSVALDSRPRLPLEGWRWLQRALTQTMGFRGLRPAGWSVGYHSLTGGGGKSCSMSFGFYGDPRKLQALVEELWDNERPGGKLEIWFSPETLERERLRITA